MNFSASTLRDRRSLFGPTHYSIANYCTDSKNDMRATFGEDIFHSLHLIPDPLKKNLADTIFTEEKMMPKNEYTGIDLKTDLNMPNRTDYSPLAGITNFISGVFNVISGAMFNKRKPSDRGSDNNGEMAVPSMWQDAKSGDENKISLVENCANDSFSSDSVGEMSDCRAAAAHCQNKLERVRQLLSQPVPYTGQVRRRPKKVFVEPNSVEDSFEDAFAPEDFETLSNDSYVQYLSPACYHCYEYIEIDGPNTKTEIGPDIESTDIVNNVPETEATTENNETPVVTDKKEELVVSCEDKLAKLKALLQGRCNKPKVIIEPELVVTEIKDLHKPIKTVNKVKDKRHKNPHRSGDKRRRMKMRRNIEDDLLFANQINPDDLSSVENSPSTDNLEYYISKQKEPDKDYFDEVSGRFHLTSVTDSEDSFQIIFNDSPKRVRRTSDCDSEDSFIVFEDSPDSCYTSNDVFGDTSDSHSCDSDSCDSDFSDSGCGALMSKLSHSLSKSVGNLADDSLYVSVSEDEVDCACIENLSLCDNLSVTDELKTGLLLDSKKKELRKNLPTKTVRFSEDPPKVHTMRVWAFAARQARAGHWERFALDRERFKRRIADVEVAVSWVLKPQHRSRVMFQRFMPWWNAQKRKELAEKKQKEEERKEAEEKEAHRLKQDRMLLDEEKARCETVDDSEGVDSKEEMQNLNEPKSMQGVKDILYNEGKLQNDVKLLRNDDKNKEKTCNLQEETEKLRSKKNSTKNKDSIGNYNECAVEIDKNDKTKQKMVPNPTISDTICPKDTRTNNGQNSAILNDVTSIDKSNVHNEVQHSDCIIAVNDETNATISTIISQRDVRNAKDLKLSNIGSTENLRNSKRYEDSTENLNSKLVNVSERNQIVDNDILKVNPNLISHTLKNT